MAFKSAFDNFELNKESFEDAVSCGCTKVELTKLFHIGYPDLVRWVEVEYNSQFEFVYEFLRQKALKDYKQVLQILASRGNSTAINTLNQFVYDMKEEEKVQKIQIVASIPDVPDAE